MNTDLTAEASQMDTKQCCLLATGSVTHIVDVHLIIERKVLCTVDKATHAVAALFASFYGGRIYVPRLEKLSAMQMLLFQRLVLVTSEGQLEVIVSGWPLLPAIFPCEVYCLVSFLRCI